MAEVETEVYDHNDDEAQGVGVGDSFTTRDITYFTIFMFTG